MKISYLVSASLISLLIYSTVFVFVIHKPLTVGTMRDYYDKKLSYLMDIDGRKIVVLAGSNGRFSHRCETIELAIGWPCSNMSISADLSLDYQLDIIKPHLAAGDAVYLPLEFVALSGTKADVMGGGEHPYIAAYDRDYLTQMPIDRLLHTLFFFDLKFLISGLGEMLLEGLGVERRFSADTMTRQGDESGHTTELGRPYREFIAGFVWRPPIAEDFDEASYKARILGDFLAWATESGVKVIGGLPTNLNDEPVPEALVMKICAFYVNRGHAFIVLENRSQYPRAYFYDTPYHLAEEYQIRHSTQIAGRLAERLVNEPGSELDTPAANCTDALAR